MMREHVLEKLDELLNKYFDPSSGMWMVEHFKLLRSELNELFTAEDWPGLVFYEIRYEKPPKLIATIITPASDVDADEWCTAFQEFIGDRFEVEPYTSPWHSIVEQYGTPTRHGAYAKTYEESQEVLKALEARLWEKAKASMAASSK